MTGFVQSQSYTWKGATNFSCCTTVDGFTFDNSGNAFVTGYFYGDTYVGNFYLTSTTPFHYNSYIAKINSLGIVLWAKTIGSNDLCRARKICADKTGNVFITGNFNTDLVYEGNTKVSSGQTDAFIMKINNLGKLLWCSQTNGASVEFYKDVVVDNVGNAYVVGTFYGTVKIGSFSVSTSAGGDMIVAKYSASNGVPQWVQQSNSTAPSYGSAYSISMDRSGNIYTLGSYGGGTTKFQGFSLTSSNPYDYFVSKLNNTGNFIFAYDAGDIPNGSVCGLSVDTASNIYIAGNFGQFSPYTATIGGTTIKSNHNSDVFIAKFNASFLLQWLKQGGSSTSGDYAYDIVSAKNGDVYVAFTGGSSINFGGVTAFSTHPGFNEIDIIKYNTFGTPQWANVSGGNGYDGVSAIRLFEKTKTVAIAGLSAANAYFGSYLVNSSGGYIAGLTENSTLNFSNQNIHQNIPSIISVFPIPAHTQINLTGLPSDGELFLYDAKGRLLLIKKISATDMKINVTGLFGNYLLKVTSKNVKFEKNILVE